VNDKRNGKDKTNTHTAPKVANTASRELRVADSASVQLIGRWLSPRPQDLDIRQTATRSPGLLFNGLHPVIQIITLDYYSFANPERMEG